MNTYEINDFNEIKIYLNGSQEYHCKRCDQHYFDYLNDNVLNDRKVDNDEWQDLVDSYFSDYIDFLLRHERGRYDNIMITGLDNGKWIIIEEITKGAA